MVLLEYEDYVEAETRYYWELTVAEIAKIHPFVNVDIIREVLLFDHLSVDKLFTPVIQVTNHLDFDRCIVTYGKSDDVFIVLQTFRIVSKITEWTLDFVEVFFFVLLESIDDVLCQPFRQLLVNHFLEIFARVDLLNSVQKFDFFRIFRVYLITRFIDGLSRLEKLWQIVIRIRDKLLLRVLSNRLKTQRIPVLRVGKVIFLLDFSLLLF